MQCKEKCQGTGYRNTGTVVIDFIYQEIWIYWRSTENLIGTLSYCPYRLSNKCVPHIMNRLRKYLLTITSLKMFTLNPLLVLMEVQFHQWGGYQTGGHMHLIEDMTLGRRIWRSDIRQKVNRQLKVVQFSFTSIALLSYSFILQFYHYLFPLLWLSQYILSPYFQHDSFTTIFSFHTDFDMLCLRRGSIENVSTFIR